MFGDLTNEKIQHPSWNDVGMGIYDHLNLGDEIMDDSAAGGVTEWEGNEVVTGIEGATNELAEINLNEKLQNFQKLGCFGSSYFVETLCFRSAFLKSASQ
jgi:hypothetical protein